MNECGRMQEYAIRIMLQKNQNSLYDKYIQNTEDNLVYHQTHGKCKHGQRLFKHSGEK